MASTKDKDLFTPEEGDVITQAATDYSDEAETLERLGIEFDQFLASRWESEFGEALPSKCDSLQLETLGGKSRFAKLEREVVENAITQYARRLPSMLAAGITLKEFLAEQWSGQFGEALPERVNAVLAAAARPLAEVCERHGYMMPTP
ncbi:MAG: hypothetical protein KDA57_21435 [Planctomycetales bacterium]|nr:hypothetical protein [Planctomycetales bacterium]